MNLKAFFLAAALAAVAPLALAAPPTRARATVLTCSNGSMGDTLTISIRGASATVTEGVGQAMTATVETNPLAYAITIPYEGNLTINRESGAGLFVGTYRTGAVRYTCYPGAKRLSAPISSSISVT